MTSVSATPLRAGRLPTPVTARLEGVGVRFDFDRRNRVVTPALSYVRRIRSCAWGLRGVSVRLEGGSGLALVGPTGSGKTTLLRVLAGVIPPDEGAVEVKGRVSTMLATGFGLQAVLTGRENSLLLAVLAGFSLAEARDRLDEIADRSGLEEAFDRPIHTYSQGMRARLHLASIRSIPADILLLDEAFESLDHEFRAVIERHGRELRERGGIVVAAGHDHAALERLCTRALWLDQGHMRAEGLYADVVGAYRAPYADAPRAADHVPPPP
jgi:ABC-type polysaccharide/polyol phosphate transport system ATPase subunit